MLRLRHCEWIVLRRFLDGFIDFMRQLRPLSMVQLRPFITPSGVGGCRRWTWIWLYWIQFRG